MVLSTTILCQLAAAAGLILIANKAIEENACEETSPFERYIYRRFQSDTLYALVMMLFTWIFPVTSVAWFIWLFVPVLYSLTWF